MMRTWVTETQPTDKLKWSLTHGTLETLNINPIDPRQLLQLLFKGP